MKGKKKYNKNLLFSKDIEELFDSKTAKLERSKAERLKNFRGRYKRGKS